MNHLGFRISEPIQVGLIDRIKLAWQLLVGSQWKPKIRFSNGVELDFSTQTILMDQPTTLLSKENLKIITHKHLILESGQTQVPGKPDGYPYGIWENTRLDENGDPILEQIDLSICKKVKHGDITVFRSTR